MPFTHKTRWAALLSLALLPSALAAAEPTIGLVKRLSGSVTLSRAGQLLKPQPGMALQQGDRLRTGADGYAGITLLDDSLLTAGPNSSLLISQFAFNSSTHDGALQATLGRGSLHMVTGLIAKRAPEKVQLQARNVILGVRGTEFIVDIGGAEE